MSETSQRTVGIFIFNDVEVLDFAGPFEVFAISDDFQPPEDRAFRVVTLSRGGALVRARNGLRAQPDYSITEHPKLDILVVPGGQGSRKVMNDEAVWDFLRRMHANGVLIMSVCTGALILGRAGLLDGLTATTHHTALGELRRAAPRTIIDAKARFVDEIDKARIITSGGISAGIDSSLYLVEKLGGTAMARETAEQMEYKSWTPIADLKPCAVPS